MLMLMYSEDNNLAITAFFLDIHRAIVKVKNSEFKEIC